jgi:hypothetical protein
LLTLKIGEGAKGSKEEGQKEQILPCYLPP